MTRDSRTKSELLFKELCAEHSLDCTRLTELHDRKQPDYELTVKEHRIVVEVKQIEPNDEDKRFTDTLYSKGMATQNRNPDIVAKRVRKHIKKSRSQINSYLNSRPGTPAVLVLFDNANNNYTDPYTIQTALYGWEQVVLQDKAPNDNLVVIDHGFAPRNNKVLRKGNNCHLKKMTRQYQNWCHIDPGQAGEMP